MIVKLSSGSLAEDAAKDTDTDARVDRRAMLVYTGDFESGDGPVSITDEHIDNLVSNHNSTLSKLARLVKGDVPAKYSPPIQLDHSTSATMTVGRLTGPLEVGEYDDDGTKRKAVYGNLRILGRENVEKVKDGRWTHLSIGADLDEGKLSELTITPFPAAKNAAMLSAKKVSLTDDTTKEGTMDKEKLKKHLMESTKCSAEEADEKLSKMSLEDEAKMSKEIDDKDAKMAADKAAKDDEDKLAADKAKEDEEKLAAEKDDEKKKTDMSAKRTSAIQLMKAIKSEQGAIKLKARSAHITARLMSLRADAKITPAEIKKIDIVKLAGSNDATVEAVMKSYADRQPVIPVGAYGSKHAEDLSKFAHKVKLAALEKETRGNMTSVQPDTKLSEDGSPMPAPAPVEAPGDAAMSGYMSLKQLMMDGDEVGAMELFKKMMEHGYMASEQAMPVMKSQEVSMTELASELETMQNKFDSLTNLVSSELSITAKDLE